MTAHVLESIDPEVIGARLAEARKARGLTQQQVADELDVARTTITAIEKGTRRPRAQELLRFAQLYGRQVGDFVRPAPVKALDAFAVQFRAARAPARGAGDERFEQDIRAFQQLCEDYLTLEALTNSHLPRRYPDPYDIRGVEPERAAEEVAISERNRLGLGDGPVADLWGLLETDVGLRIFAPRFAGSRLAGLFAYTEELGGCIAVNGNHPEERRRWTLAHEYGHFLTDRFRAEITTLSSSRRLPESERFADAFARFFLMPTSGLSRRFLALKRARDGSITPADVLALCHLYGVSFQAMMLRLEELKLLPAGTWDELRDSGSKPVVARRMIGLPEPDAERPILPRRYETLAVQAYSQGQLSEGRLASLLRTDRVGARQRVRDLTEGETYEEDGTFYQLSLDLASALLNGR